MEPVLADLERFEWLTERLDTTDLYRWQERNRDSRKGTLQESAIEAIYFNLALVRSNSIEELEEFYRNIPKAFKRVAEEPEVDFSSNQVIEIVDGVLDRLGQYSPDTPLPIDSRLVEFKRVTPMPYWERGPMDRWTPEECVRWLQIGGEDTNS